MFAIDNLVCGQADDSYDPLCPDDELFPVKPLASFGFATCRIRSDDFLDGLSAEEFARAAQLRRLEDRLTYCVAHGILRSKLSSVLRVPAATLAFERGRYGRPRLRTHSRLPYFSLSYRRGIVAIALAHTPVGVDVEYVDDTVQHLQVVDRFFEPAEVAFVRGLAPNQQLRAFFGLWTRKEAVAKAAGVRLKDGLATDVTGENASLNDEEQTLCQYRLATFPSIGAYTVSAALREG